MSGQPHVQDRALRRALRLTPSDIRKYYPRSVSLRSHPHIIDPSIRLSIHAGSRKPTDPAMKKRLQPRPHYGAARASLSVGSLSCPSAEDCSFSIRIAGRRWGTRHERRAYKESTGKPRVYKMRGFSLIHAPDSVAHTDGRAFLFAERHIRELKG